MGAPLLLGGGGSTSSSARCISRRCMPGLNSAGVSNMRERHRNIDHADVREGLRKVTQMLPTDGINFLSKQA